MTARIEADDRPYGKAFERQLRAIVSGSVARLDKRIRAMVSAATEMERK